MRLRFIVVIMSFFYNSLVFSQLANPTLGKLKIINNKLPAEIHETSGALWFNGQVWTFNDSGGEPCLYALDNQSQAVTRRVQINNALNVDWEDITQDSTFIYISDVGNNKGSRKTLCVYKVTKADILSGLDNVTAEKIEFSYNDRKWPQKAMGYSAYDCEAMICDRDSIFVFTKNWVLLQSDVYGFPVKPGFYNVNRISRIDAQGLVTGACLSSNKKYIFTIGYADFMPFILCLKNTSYEIARRFDYPNFLGYQTEAITFVNNDSIIVTSEKSPVKPIAIFGAKVNWPK